MTRSVRQTGLTVAILHGAAWGCGQGDSAEAGNETAAERPADTAVAAGEPSVTPAEPAGVGGQSSIGGDESVAEEAGRCGPSSIGLMASKGCFDYVPMTIQDDENLLVSSATPNEPLVGGEPYAVSLTVGGSAPTLEIWGTNEPCGDGLEMLLSQPSTSGDNCFILEPTESHSELLLVARGTSTVFLSEKRYCGRDGTCE